MTSIDSVKSEQITESNESQSFIVAKLDDSFESDESCGEDYTS